ncbi:MAG: hypothetical protein NTW75_15880 [Planctomycetales bacterium]|nr:hypothetical protein [Planctomycetales bacterium]
MPSGIDLIRRSTLHEITTESSLRTGRQFTAAIRAGQDFSNSGGVVIVLGMLRVARHRLGK